MKVFPYGGEGKDKEEKGLAVDVASVLQGMQDLEENFGVTKEKILDSWYELKRQLREVLVQHMQAEMDKEEKEKKAGKE